jgi:hypothetical protein
MSGEIDDIHARTVAKLSDSLLKSISIDLEYKRLVNDMGNSIERGVADLNLNIIMAPENNMIRDK